MFRSFFVDLVQDLSRADLGMVLLISLIVITVIVMDAFALAARLKSKASGLGEYVKALGIDGGRIKPGKEYISPSQSLAGKPDALIEEDGFVIPVEIKPLSSKLRDRHVAQLLVYCRLIEEFEKKRPPYGYLILGKERRRVKVTNSDKKQQWLSEVLHSMHSILEGGASKPTPAPFKCNKCDVNEHCQYRPKEVEPIGVTPEGLVQLDRRED